MTATGPTVGRHATAAAVVLRIKDNAIDNFNQQNTRTRPHVESERVYTWLVSKRMDDRGDTRPPCGAVRTTRPQHTWGKTGIRVSGFAFLAAGARGRGHDALVRRLTFGRGGPLQVGIAICLQAPVGGPAPTASAMTCRSTAAAGFTHTRLSSHRCTWAHVLDWKRRHAFFVVP